MHILVVEALLVAIYSTGDEQILIHIRKPCRSRTCLVRIAGPCPAVPVPVQLVASRPRFGCYSQGRTPQLVWASWRETQLGRNQLERHSWTGASYSHESGTRPTAFSYVYKYLLVPQVE